MAPIAKEHEIPNSASPATTPQPRPQPVALEVPVMVNGARTVDGSDKREPFSEMTQTVLVLANGAVIRLNATVAPGQLLFLTNEKTKKEVVCQVVKSKNYRSVSGYVELEFTEPVVGFWGMRFPTDRLGPAVPPSVVPASRASVSAIFPTGTNAAAKLPELIPAVPAPVAKLPEAKPVEAAPVNVAPAIEKQVPPAPSVFDSPALFAEKSSSPVVEGEDSSAALKKETARLQEQFSSMLFAEAPLPKPVPPVEPRAISEATTKIFELTKAEAAESLPTNDRASKQFEPLKLTPIAPKTIQISASQEEEVKIPAWLEPLARNGSTPAPVVTEPVETSEAQVAGESYEFLSQQEPLATETAELAAPSFGSYGSEENNAILGEASTGGSKKGLWILAIAAGLLLAAGGGWWYTQQTGNRSVNAASVAVQPKTQSSPEASPQYLASTSQPPTATRTGASATVVSAPVTNSALPVSSPAVEVQKIAATRELAKPEAGNNSSSAASRAAQPVEQAKKPALGSVHLSAPTVKGNKSGIAGDESEPGIAMESTVTSSAASLNAGLVASHGKQPAAPVTIGGDVKPARLISSVPPSYPQLARSQRLSGDVRLDALIDESGRVTTMNVVSGPVLLHQAAKDALHQWKYQPATLDGKPVSMHLTVTIQFRLH
jgi:protein TonB